MKPSTTCFLNVDPFPRPRSLSFLFCLTLLLGLVSSCQTSTPNGASSPSSSNLVKEVEATSQEVTSQEATSQETAIEENAIASSNSSGTANGADVSSPLTEKPATENPQVAQHQNDQSVFAGEGFTVTITGSGASAAYRGCNANQECLEIPQAANYTRGTYTWENDGYTYVMAPATVTAGAEAAGAYQLRVYDPSRNTIVDTVMRPVAAASEPERIGGDGGLEANILDEFYSQSESLGACSEYFDLDASKDSSATYRVNENDAIVEVLCFLAAYQGAYEYWFYQSTASGGEFIPLSFDVYIEAESGDRTQTQVRELGGLPTYDPTQETLTIFTKYRGLGDCGAYGEYQWQGTEFKLVTYRSKDECDGNMVDLMDYPQLYP